MAPEWVSRIAMPFRTHAFGALALLAAVVTTSACTPDTEDLLESLHDQSHAAEATGRPCPGLAGDVAWRGLPPSSSTSSGGRAAAIPPRSTRPAAPWA